MNSIDINVHLLRVYIICFLPKENMVSKKLRDESSTSWRENQEKLL